MGRVFHTDEEKRAILDFVPSIVEKNPLKSNLAVLRDAQALAVASSRLNPQRTRKFSALTQAPWFLECIKSIRTPMEEEEEKGLSEIPLSELYREIFRREFLPDIQERIQQSVQREIAAQLDQLNRPQEARTQGKEKRTTAIVIGLIPWQEKEIERTFPQLKFVFYKDFIPNLSLPARNVFVMTKFIDHSVYYKIKKSSDNGHFRHIAGGMTELKREITEFQKNI